MAKKRKPKKCRVYSYEPDKCVTLYVSVPIAEILDCAGHGKDAIDEAVAHYTDMLGQEIRRRMEGARKLLPKSMIKKSR